MRKIAVVLMLLITAATVSAMHNIRSETAYVPAAKTKYMEGAQQSQAVWQAARTSGRTPRTGYAVEKGSELYAGQKADTRFSYYEAYKRGTIEKSKEAYQVGLSREKSAKERYREGQEARKERLFGRR